MPRHQFSLGCVALAFHAMLILVAFGALQKANAQITIVDSSQSDLIQRSASEQAEILAAVVRKSEQNRKCARATASLEQSYDNRSGGWLVLCEEGSDYWVMVPVEASKASIALPCVVAKVAGTDCYANLRTVLPEHVAQCAASSPLDRVIRACTAFLQSGRFDNNAEVLFAATFSRGLAYANYGQLEVALLDLDRATSLRPNDVAAIFNRAVTLERLGRYLRHLSISTDATASSRTTSISPTNAATST
jgi:tetratricopeptide (TPR) repeat protein